MTTTRAMQVLTILGLLAALSACRGGEGDGETGGAGGTGSGPGAGQGGFSDATSLSCPRPGQLPFALETTGFQTSESEAIAGENTRSKEEAADTLGLPGGVLANTYLEVEGAPAAGPVVYQGRRARTGEDSGLSSSQLPGENVSLWFYDSGQSAWQSFGRAVTDDDGRYAITPATPVAAPLGQPVYAMLEADGSCAEHFDYLMPSGTKLILTDIDGTLTLSDDELFKQIDDGSYQPAENASAAALMNKWSEKGYQVIYLSARPHAFRAETRAWLEALGFPDGPLVTANALVFDDSAREYKRAWVNRMLVDYGWAVEAAYGNATSDIDAYEDAGIPKDITFIVGEFAGAFGTGAIEDNDYTSHIADFVDPHPDA
ncbi:MAG: HAD family acid phosphatase [Polyangiaceae bacterium]